MRSSTIEDALTLAERLDAEDADINPFTPQERDQIIEAFRTNKFCHGCRSKDNKHSHYTAYVRFLFYTGCRPSEAIGLRWKNIDFERSVILFDEAAVQLGQGVARKKGLKTQVSRRFKINSTSRLYPYLPTKTKPAKAGFQKVRASGLFMCNHPEKSVD